jgi:hypothetical protein
MTVERSEIEGLVERVRILERRQKVFQQLIVLAVVGALLVGATPKEPSAKIFDEDVIAAKALIVESITVVGSLDDVSGTARMEIAASQDPRIAIFPRAGLPGVVLSQTAIATGLLIRSEEGGSRLAYLGVDRAATGEPEAEMFLGRNGEKIATVLTNKFGGTFGIFDAAGRARGVFGMTDSGPTVGVTDEGGRRLP